MAVGGDMVAFMCWYGAGEQWWHGDGGGHGAVTWWHVVVMCVTRLHSHRRVSRVSCFSSLHTLYTNLCILNLPIL